MNELIKITETNGKKAVSARELYNKLGFHSAHWAKWYKKNIVNNQFAIENEDYTQLTLSVRSSDFALSVDFAKKLSMLARTETGEKIRQYFIEVEKIAKQTPLLVPQNFAEALELAAKQQRSLDSHKAEIARLKPKAEFVEQSMESEELIEMSMAVKVLDLPYGRNIFYALLRKTGVFFRNRNEPLQEFVNKGYFKIKQKLIKRKNNPNIVVSVPFITQKGIVRMSGWLKERGFNDKNHVETFLKKM